MKWMITSWFNWKESTKRFVQLSIILTNYFILASTITRCISVSAFASSLRILLGITSFAIGLKICAIALGVKK